MDAGVAAVAAGAVGAALGGIAAIIGAKIAAEKNTVALLQQVNHQAQAERAQWVRNQRATAYEEFLRTWDEYTLARGRFHIERPPKYENWRNVQELHGRLGTAAFAIQITGPESVQEVTSQAFIELTAMAFPDELRAEFYALNTRMRETNDPQLRDQMTKIAEEMLYRGSWDGAIDVPPVRQRFLRAATEALGTL
ncbi:hypothetical protein G9272_28450 [Streptomyces asoensis]|uniref:Uncharacterized protein n=1 Tax=Streptomyces asoensis TaxID=249586 RepID=A0A6M4WTA1_9ACTN|nr:hypothetical protein [Streptomyces asoensis]QJT03724.1 hypothetical protein G9272_28450 [Streptomyces asoensis]